MRLTSSEPYFFGRKIRAIISNLFSSSNTSSTSGENLRIERVTITRYRNKFLLGLGTKSGVLVKSQPEDYNISIRY